MKTGIRTRIRTLNGQTALVPGSQHKRHSASLLSLLACGIRWALLPSTSVPLLIQNAKLLNGLLERGRRLIGQAWAYELTSTQTGKGLPGHIHQELTLHLMAEHNDSVW